MKKIILTLVILLSFLTISYAKTMPFYCYGTCKKSEKNAKNVAIETAKEDCLKQLCLLYIDQSDYENNKEEINNVLLKDSKKYLTKTYKLNTKKQKINGENYISVYFYVDIDINKFYDQLKSISSISNEIEKPVIYIEAVAKNNIKTDDSDILRSELTAYFKEMNFNVLDKSLVDFNNSDEKLKFLKESNCSLIVQASSTTNLKIVEHQLGNFYNLFATLTESVFNLTKIGRDGLEAIKECSGTTNLNVTFYNVNSGKINTSINNFQGKAKGNVTFDNSNGVSHNSVKNAVNDFKKNAPLAIYSALQSFNKNIYTLAVGNISNAENSVLCDYIKSKDNNLIDITYINNINGINYTVTTKTDFDGFMAFIEGAKVNDKPLNIVHVENNIVGAYLTSDKTDAVNESNYMAKLFNDNPASVLESVSIATIKEFDSTFEDISSYELVEQNIYLIISDHEGSFEETQVNEFKNKLYEIDKNITKINAKNDYVASFDITTKTNINQFIQKIKNIEINGKSLFIQSVSNDTFISGQLVKNENILYSTNKSFDNAKLYMITFQCSRDELEEFKTLLIENDNKLIGISSTFLNSNSDTHVLSHIVSGTDINQLCNILSTFKINDKDFKVIKSYKEDHMNQIECNLSVADMNYIKGEPDSNCTEYNCSFSNCDIDTAYILKDKFLEFDNEIVSLTYIDYKNSGCSFNIYTKSKKDYEEFIKNLKFDNKIFTLQSTIKSENHKLKIDQYFLGFSVMNLSNDGTNEIVLGLSCNDKEKRNELNNQLVNLIKEKDNNLVSSEIIDNDFSVSVKIITKSDINSVANLLKGTAFLNGYIDIYQLKEPYITLLVVDKYVEEGNWLIVTCSALKNKIKENEAKEYLETFNSWDEITNSQLDSDNDYGIMLYYLKTTVSLEELGNKFKDFKIRNKKPEVTISENSIMVMLNDFK